MSVSPHRHYEIFSLAAAIVALTASRHCLRCHVGTWAGCCSDCQVGWHQSHWPCCVGPRAGCHRPRRAGPCAGRRPGCRVGCYWSHCPHRVGPRAGRHPSHQVAPRSTDSACPHHPLTPPPPSPSCCPPEKVRDFKFGWDDKFEWVECMVICMRFEIRMRWEIESKFEVSLNAF
jgi:hypothetical protein